MSGKEVTLIIDGREVIASEGEMLHDAARRGDVEIPVFCYEPKLGDPVGACRMCLVEIEGMPKLQTSCSTPVRDGMVVHTMTDQVKHAQSAVVEFLLVNHPLDCPICDKGGECPLQDISIGWGPGRSRFTDPKRHFQKPVELSPLVAIDRERCILCYRCVRFSQEVAEDAQLQLLERGDRSFVGTFDDRPYVAPFHGNITELCPVGALTSYTYRFRARPWDIEQAGSVCTLCPSQCNVSFTVRDEQVKRVLGRDNAEVDDGWLCDRGRYGFEMFGAARRIEGPQLKGGAATDWKGAIAAAARGLAAGGGASAALVGDASNEEGYLLQRLLREALGSAHIESRPARGPSREALVELFQPNLSARVRDIDDAEAILLLGTDPLHSSPILDLRIRKAIRRNGARLAVATDRPTALDGGAEAVSRYSPGGGARFLSELASSLRRPHNEDDEVSELAETLRKAERVVIIWGDRIAREGAARGLLDLASALDLAARDGSGLLEIPEVSNARGLREAGCLPDAGPGLGASTVGRNTEEIRAGLESGELKSLLLFGVDPIRDFPDSNAWAAAIGAADFVVAFSMFENETSARADIVFPLETHAEKDGTLTHPDGRLQRVRPSAPPPGEVLSNLTVLAELSAALGQDHGLASQPSAFAAMTAAVPFYATITDSEIGGRGIRWQDHPSAASFPIAETAPTAAAAPLAGTSARHGEGPSEQQAADAHEVSGSAPLFLGTYRDLWAGPITELNPPLHFLAPTQRAELSPADAERLGLRQGDEVSVRANGASVRARVMVRERMPEGAFFLIEGTAEGNANVLLNGGPVSAEIEKVSEVRR
ncbi:MAG: NADH-quinone oxidoreductase subunit NuoG [Solirubrobacterales bacterium]